MCFLNKINALNFNVFVNLNLIEQSLKVNYKYTGAHTGLERFDTLSPMIVELFHIIQDFLQVIPK